MARLVHIKVIGHLDRAGGTTSGVMTIDREAGIVIVRPKGRQRSYELPVDRVADMICARVIQGEVNARRAEKAANRRRSR